MKKIIGVVGSGMIGRNPFDPTCWSGSGYNLFTKLQSQGLLRRAFGVEVPHPLRGMLMLKNFHRNRTLWAQRFNLDPVYYRALTREIRKRLRDEDFENDNVILQIGGHYNGFRAAAGKIPTYSYHDGNIAGMMNSPFFPKKNLPYARRAFDYEKSVYQDMSKIFVMAEYWRRSFIEDFGVEPRRVVNIGVGVNTDIPPVAPKDYSRKHIVFVGIDFARKGGENLANAFRLLQRRHPDATLHIIGPPDNPGRAPAAGPAQRRVPWAAFARGVRAEGQAPRGAQQRHAVRAALALRAVRHRGSRGDAVPHAGHRHQELELSGLRHQRHRLAARSAGGRERDGREDGRVS